MPTISCSEQDLIGLIGTTLDRKRFLALLPLFPRELDYWSAFGPHPLLDLLAERGVTELFDPARKPVVS